MDASDLVARAVAGPTALPESETPSDLADAQILAAVDGCRLTTIRSGSIEAHPAADAVVVRARDPDTGSPVVALLMGSVSYPLCGQPVMRVRQGVYMLPTTTHGETLCLRAEAAPFSDIVALEATLSAFAVLRDRGTGEVVSVGGGAGVDFAPSAPPDSSGEDDDADDAASGSGAGARSAAVALRAAKSGDAGWGDFLARAVATTKASVATVPGAVAAGFAAGKTAAAASASDDVVPVKSERLGTDSGVALVPTAPPEETGVRSLMASVATRATATAGSAWGSMRAAAAVAVSEKQRRFPKAESTKTRTVEDADAEDASGSGAVKSEGAAWKWAEGALVEAGQWAAVGLVLGGRATGSGVRAAGATLTSRLAPAVEGKEVEVSGKTMRQIRRARMASSSAVMVTKALAVTMTELAKGMGIAMSKMVTESKSGSKLVAKASKSATARGLRRVGLASLIAVGDIWEGLEEGLRTVGADTMETAGTVVEHRYGEDAATATREGLGVVGDLGNAAVNVGKAAPVRVVVSASKTAAQKVVLGDDASKALVKAQRERARGKGTA